MVGDTCEKCDKSADITCPTSGARPNYNNFKVVACDGKRDKVTMCADPGYLRHFRNVDAD
jgi:hypothetical protein